jgi:hypothetical protein
MPGERTIRSARSLTDHNGQLQPRRQHRRVDIPRPTRRPWQVGEGAEEALQQAVLELFGSSAGRVPDSDDAIRTRCGYLAVRAERDVGHRALMTRRTMGVLAAGEIPDPDSAVLAAAGKPPSVWAEGDNVDRLVKCPVDTMWRPSGLSAVSRSGPPSSTCGSVRATWSAFQSHTWIAPLDRW